MGSTATNGHGFLDHMLEQLIRHGAFSLSIKGQGDLHIALHHLAEDKRPQCCPQVAAGTHKVSVYCGNIHLFLLLGVKSRPRASLLRCHLLQAPLLCERLL